MNKIKRISLALALMVSGVVSAALVPVTEVVEVAAAELRAPANEAARMNVKPCTTCEVRTVRVDRDTVYRIGDFKAAAVSRQAFRDAVASAGENELGVVYVKFDVNSGVVLELVVQGSE